MKSKILVVDDDSRNIFAVQAVLEGHEMKVIHAENGLQAVHQLEVSRDINMVLLDLMMPEMDGFEALRLIRENPDFAELPIIALTAKAMQGDKEKCLEAGASDYITKPVDRSKLLAMMHFWLKKAKKQEN